jgi:hypothetical protein
MRASAETPWQGVVRQQMWAHDATRVVDARSGSAREYRCEIE